MTYTLLISCENDAQAEAIHKALHDAVIGIAGWHQAHPFKSQKLFKGEAMRTPAPPEIETGKAHGFEWTVGQGWLALDDPAEASGVVSRLENVVFLTGGEPFADPAPWLKLLDALGGSAIVDDAAGALRTTVSTTAPDAASAEQVVSVLHAYLDGETIAPAPWLAYPGGEPLEHADALLALEPAYLQHIAAIRAGTYDQVADDLPPLDLDDAETLDDVRGAVEISAGTAHADGAAITLRDLVFAEIASGLPALIAWLTTDMRCQGVDQSFMHE